MTEPGAERRHADDSVSTGTDEDEYSEFYLGDERNAPVAEGKARSRPNR